MNSDQFRELHKKYSDLKIGEDIAYAGARNPLGGECEGFVDCDFYVWSITDGRYLELYPEGRHVDGFLKDLENYLAEVVKQANYYSVGEESELTKEVDQAVALIARTKSDRKEKLLELLSQVRRAKFVGP